MNSSIHDPFQGRAVLSIRDTATALSICPSNVYKLIGVGVLSSVRIGRRHLVEVQSIKNYLADCSEGSHSAQEAM